MTVDELKALFEKYGETEFLAFKRIEPKLSTRPDLHAFILLDRLVPGTMDIVAAAEHDEIFIEVTGEELAAVVTEEQVRDLVRCGVRWDSDGDGLAMFA